MVFFAKVDYRVWRKFGTFAYLFSFLLCVLVMFPIPGLVRSSHGQARWLNLGPFSFQPSELAKLAVIFFLAMLIEKISRSLEKFRNVVKVGLIILPLFAVVAKGNLSTAVIILGIAVCMLFVASPKILGFFAIGGVGAIGVGCFIMFAGYRAVRVNAWLHPETAGDAGYQTMQALYAIGSGKLFGKGLGQSLQKMGNVPEAQNDMIFSIICEELGLFGAVCVILLFMLLLWRMMVIANNAKDMYGALLVTGIMSHIAIQVILNIAVVTNVIPNTGVTLPFISYGGTSLVFLMAEMGLVLSVSKGIRLEAIE
jgi:cell division protein FtsW